ncbi:MAG TPA: VOC family protein [Candidatus Acidoferrales bacterium]|nr:VOC family protein [Candidatus Acidoferrales bacterium]
MFSPKGISEIVLVVKDVGRAAAFYQEVVGLKVDQRVDENWCWLWAGAPGAPQRIGLTTGPLSYGAEHIRGPMHFALRLEPEELPAAMAHLRAKGIEIEGPVRFEDWDARSIYFDDLDGNRVEFCALPVPQPSRVA